MKDQFFFVASICFAVITVAIAYCLFFYLPGAHQEDLKHKTQFDACYNTCLTSGVPPIDGACQNGQVKGTLSHDISSDQKKGDPWCYPSEDYCFAACNK